MSIISILIISTIIATLIVTISYKLFCIVYDFMDRQLDEFIAYEASLKNDKLDSEDTSNAANSKED